MGDKSHEKGPQVFQDVLFVLEHSDAQSAPECRGRITHVGLKEVTASFVTTTGPFTSTFAHGWLMPSDVPNEWTVRARLAPTDPRQ